MSRTLSIGLFALLGIILLVGIILLMVAQMRDPIVADGWQRDVSPRVVWGNDNVVTVALNHSSQPDRVCPPEHRVTTVVLLLDRSDSMSQQDAFVQATAAATRFISTIDLTTSQIATIFFADQPTVAQSFTQDVTQLQAGFSGFVPGGGTNIGAALQEASNLLTTIQDDSLPIVVLLTDGVTDDPEQAIQVGQTLKDEGVHLVTIALGDADTQFLLELASTPADSYQAPTPNQLSAIYTNLATEISQTTIRDFALTEQIDSSMTLIPASLQPETIPTGQTVTWQIPALSIVNGAEFRYQLTPLRYGYQNINEDSATMSYLDCVTGPVTLSLLAGPAVMVLPSPGLTALAAFLPFLVPVFLLFWSRKPQSDPTPTSSQPPARRQPPPLPDKTPLWLSRLTNQDVLLPPAPPTDVEELVPTVIIGLGPVGREVLDQMAQALQARYGQQRPVPIRLLQIDVQPKKKGGERLVRPRHLNPDEWVLLEPDLDEIKRMLQRDRDKRPHLRWYDPDLASGRMHARMAVFYDLLNGARNSLLWQSLERTALKLIQPRLRLVGSTFDDTSGMLIDIARLMQIITRQDKNVEMWLSGPVGQDWGTELLNDRRKIRASDQVVRNLATLRELERFQRNARTPFHYVHATHEQSQLHSESRFAVVQTLYLFVPPDNTSAVTDHLATITDALLSTMHQSAQQAFSQHLTGSQQKAGELVNQKGLGVVCSLGAYAVRIPLVPLSEALSWRIVQDILFEQELGLLPTLALLPDGQYEEIDEEASISVDGNQEREFATQLAEGYSGRLDHPEFFHALSRYVAQSLNGEASGSSEQFAKQRMGGLLKSERWLKALQSVVRSRDGGRTAAARIDTLLTQLENWQTFLREQVKPVVRSRYAEAHSQLEMLHQQRGRYWTLTDELDLSVYKKHLRPTPKQTQELQRIMRRFGWHVTYRDDTSEWFVQLLAPAPHFVWDETTYLPDLVVERQTDAFLNRLYTLAYLLARHKTEGETPLAVAQGLEIRFWLDKALPRLPITRAEASESRSFAEKYILVAPESVQATAIQQRLREHSQRQDLELCSTQDQTAVTLLTLRDHVPLSNYDGYDEDAWMNNVVDSSLYVWHGERVATEREVTGDRINAQLVGWIEQNQPLLDSVGKAYLIGLLRHNKDQTRWQLPGLGDWPGAGLGQAIENLMGDDPVLWPKNMQLKHPQARQEAMNQFLAHIEAQQKSIWEDPAQGKNAFIYEAEKDCDSLLITTDKRVRDFALYLKGLLKTL